MSGQDWHCSVCRQRKSSSFCFCCAQETFLCEQCLFAHYQKSPFQVHLTMPIFSYGQHNIPGYFERLQDRSMKIPAGREELLKNVIKVDDCITEIERTTEEIILAVNNWKAKVIEQLRSRKATLEQLINDALAEVERTMHDDAPTLHSQMAKDLRACGGDLSIFEYFTYKIEKSNVISALEAIFTYSFSYPQFFLPGIKNNYLRLHNVKTSKTQEFLLSRSFTDGLRLCFINEQSILVVGSSPASPNTFTITLPSAIVSEIRPLRSPRRLPVLTAIGDMAYVFAGQCLQCDKLHIPTNEWTPLSDLQSMQNPSSSIIKNGKVYLIGISSPLEIFDIASETFQQVATNFNGLTSDMVCFEESGEIVMISRNSVVGRWRYGDLTIRITQFQQSIETPMSQCVPMLLGRNLFFVSWNTGNLNCFNLDKPIVSEK